MVKRRMTYSRRRKTMRRTRRKIMTVPRVTRSLKPAVLYIKRKQWSTTWIPSTVATSDFWKSFAMQLSFLPNSTELTNLFDQYKICAIKWTFFPRFTSFSGNDNTDTTPPGVTNLGQTMMHICYDNRSTVTPAGTYSSANLNTFMEQGRIKTILNPNRPVSVYMKPVIQGEYIGGTATNMFTKSKWLPTSSPSINHIGPNIFVQDHNFSGTFAQQWDILVTTYVALRNQK